MLIIVNNLSNRTECYCGNSYGKYGKINDDECNYKCAGNSSQYCGGRAKNSIHVAPVFSTLITPISTTPANARVLSLMTRKKAKFDDKMIVFII